jgi:excisionase family DNA binding protein
MNNDKLMTRNEAATYLGVKSSTLAVWACTKTVNLPFVKVGRCVRYRREDLDQFISQNTVGALAVEG